MAGIVLSGLLGCSPQMRQVREPDPDIPHIRVLTYNVNYGLAGDAAAAEAIIRTNPDIVLLQETNEDWERALRAELGDRFDTVRFHHCCTAGGLGILSRYPIVEEEIIEPPEGGWFPAWRGIVDSPIGPLQILNVHLRPQLSESGSVVSGHFSTPPIRRAEITEYHSHLDDELPTLIVGDFNEDDGDAIEYLEARGLKSALREFTGFRDTWHWNTSIGTVRSELDHVVYDERLDPLEVRVIREGSSDHYPVLAVIQRATVSR